MIVKNHAWNHAMTLTTTIISYLVSVVAGDALEIMPHRLVQQKSVDVKGGWMGRNGVSDIMRCGDRGR